MSAIEADCMVVNDFVDLRLLLGWKSMKCDVLILIGVATDHFFYCY